MHHARLVTRAGCITNPLIFSSSASSGCKNSIVSFALFDSLIFLIIIGYKIIIVFIKLILPTKATQRVTVGQILGSSTLGSNYIKDIDYYLARGHLAARSDFVYSTHQRATFWFINTAPQWQTFNSGNWKVLEDNLREYKNHDQ
jgi:DNA/RNA non-specific endonuclease